MKTLALIAALVALTHISFSQDYMDEIASKACECLDAVPETVELEKFNMELGLCMTNAATPYGKQLKKDYGIDLTEIDTQGEELGRIIGLRMVSICPQSLVKLVNKVNEDEAGEPAAGVTIGEVTAISDGKFVEFSIKDQLGKTSKYYWLTFVESNTELATDYKNLMDKPVQVTYSSQEFFDARIGEYRIFYVIEKLEVRDE